MRRFLLAAAFVLLASAPAREIGASALAAASDGWAPPAPEETWFQVFTGPTRIGHAHRTVTKVFDTIILEEKFQALIKGKVARFETVVVYRTGNPPQPQEGKAATLLGDVKLMEGKVTVAAKPGEKGVAQIEVTGFADRNLKVHEPPLKQTTEQPLPEGPILFQSALLYLAPRLLPKAGRLEGVTLAEFPDDIDFPELLNLKPGRALERTAPDPTGRWQILLKAPQGGGRGEVPVARLTFDGNGALVKYEWAKFVFQPSSQEEALAPVEGPKGPGATSARP